ncbi:ubiquitin-like Rad60 SUMO-like protein [Rhizoctonia solani]|uniref:Ubiquitin-like Rad60 SUMO-like protein n=1 Tax=Rhizoctonia solani TaxID=456999 RepID=A0A8H8SYY4_9AGAM|nr:ubiquitin-like Rad60 SUMO-like protein [Rhizoctonia solani]QRW22994.1 ubiquitin-like Rad60 SUMO-like protein [Rhizoctonia solani]
MSDGQPEGNTQAHSDSNPISIKASRNVDGRGSGAYASKVGKDVNTFRFLYDGNRINDEDTPSSLDMEDDDTIDVMVEQVGGSV